MAVASGSDKAGTTLPAEPAGAITSGTASEAMIRAATSASSAEPSGTGAIVPPAPAGPAGDTPVEGSDGTAAATPDATGQPKPAGPPAPPAGTRTETPEPRIVAATRNARADERNQIFRQLGVTTEQVPDVPVGIRLLGDLRRDTEGFARQLAGELGYELVPRGQTPHDPNPSEAGLPQEPPKTWGEMQAILKAQEQRLTRAFEARAKPLEDARTLEERRARASEHTRQTQASSASALATARTYPHFKEHEPEIAERLAAMDPDLRAQMGPVGAMLSCYNAILAEKVFPTIATTAEEAAAAKVRAGYERKARSSGSVVPSGSGGEGKPVELKNPTDLAKHMQHLAAQASDTT